MALPGVRTVLSDRFYTLLPQNNAATGQRVLIIGTRDTADGTAGVADYDPYLARNESAVITAFGEGSQLHKGFIEAAAGGAVSVYLVALPSDTVDDDLTDTADGNRFDKAFDAAEIARPDIIVPYGRGSNTLDWDDYADVPTAGGADPFGFYADNDSVDTDSLLIRVASKVKEISERSHPCFAVMGVKPWVSGGRAMTAADVNTHIEFADLVDRDTNDYLDATPYVSVVATELRPVGYPSDYGWTNGAAHYAGAVSAMDIRTSSTNKTVYNVESVRYDLNLVQAESLTDKGLIPVKLDFTRAPIWVDGQTFAAATSDYVRLTTLRIIQATVQMVRGVSQKFIGETATLENRNALETSITSGLRTFQQAGALINSNFIMSYYPRQNMANIDLVLQPAFELRNINITVSVQL